MALYEELKGRNLVRLLSDKLRAGVLEMRESDGRFVPKLAVEWNTPWVFVKSSYRVNCFLWKDITFHGIVERSLPKEKQFVPAGCQDCFKVVVRPRTLEELFKLEKIQKELDMPSKCGIEVRPSVFGNYGGYFYNRGLMEGLECYKTVRKAVDENISPDVKVLLKRACTEMEHGIGRSDEWAVTQEQLSFEMHLQQRFVNDVPIILQSDHAKDDIYQRWIERAYEVGDETYKLFTDGPLYPDYVTYHHLADRQNLAADGGANENNSEVENGQNEM